MLKGFFMGCMVGAISTMLISVSMVMIIAVIAVVSDWESFSLGLGSIQLMEHKSNESGFTFETGEGLFILPVLGGLLNGLGVLFFRSRLSPLRRDAN